MDGEVPHIWNDHAYLIVKESVGRQLVLPMDGYRQEVQITAGNVDQVQRAFEDWVYEHRIVDVISVLRTLCERNGLPFVRHAYLPDKFHPLTWDMAARMREQGHVIASHTWSHRILSILTPREKEMELARSREVLEQRLGIPPDFIVYPYGKARTVDEESLVLARKVGYRWGFLNVPRPIPGPAEMTIPRFGLPRRLFRPHLFVTLSGLKHALEGLGGAADEIP